MLVIVPNYIADAINAKLDAAIAACPEAAKEREVLYEQLLGYFNEHGIIPEFHIQKNEPIEPNEHVLDDLESEANT